MALSEFELKKELVLQIESPPVFFCSNEQSALSSEAGLDVRLLNGAVAVLSRLFMLLCKISCTSGSLSQGDAIKDQIKSDFVTLDSD